MYPSTIRIERSTPMRRKWTCHGRENRCHWMSRVSGELWRAPFSLFAQLALTRDERLAWAMQQWQQDDLPSHQGANA